MFFAALASRIAIGTALLRLPPTGCYSPVAGTLLEWNFTNILFAAGPIQRNLHQLVTIIAINKAQHEGGWRLDCSHALIPKILPLCIAFHDVFFIFLNQLVLIHVTWYSVITILFAIYSFYILPFKIVFPSRQLTFVKTINNKPYYYLIKTIVDLQESSRKKHSNTAALGLGGGGNIEGD